jgi:Polysaccharide pyruvyl transferase
MTPHGPTASPHVFNVERDALMNGWADCLHRSGPLVLFGAFDRHNFGDMLFPHLVEAVVPGRDLVFAGVVHRDLRRYGGHRVEAIAQVAETWEARYGVTPADVIHVGGETLSCDSYLAALMALMPNDASVAIQRHESERLTDRERMAWAQRLLGIRHCAAYVLPKTFFTRPGVFIFNGTGGADLDGQAGYVRDEVLTSLRTADYVGVRDPIAREILASAGIEAHLVLDPATRVAQLFAERIRAKASTGEVGLVRRTFPDGYVAVQFSAAFHDERTLAEITRELDLAAASSGLGIVLFRAGAAFAHDDLGPYLVVARTMLSLRVRLFVSLDIWDICALISRSRTYCGSSLHGRIVAESFGVPAISLMRKRPPDAQPKKVAAYAATAGWPLESLHEAGSIAAGLAAAAHME